MRPISRSSRALVALLVLAACSTTQDNVTSPLDGEGAVFAKGKPGVTVTSATPSWGEQGEAGKKVNIAGSGFTAGSVVAWERNGVPDPKIEVVSAVVLSASSIEATINIAVDAELDLYDISVMALGGKGIGSESFEVTTAISIGTLGGDAEAEDASESWGGGAQVVGWSNVGSAQHAFSWSAGGMEDLGPGRAVAVDDSGSTIVGWTDPEAIVWTGSPGSWTRTILPRSAGTAGARARAVATDAQGIILGGTENVITGRNSTRTRAVVWRRNGTTWTVTVLGNVAGNPNVALFSINARGQAVGRLPTAAVYWDSLGVASQLPGSGASAEAIDATGTLVVGSLTMSQAVYWTAQVGAGGTRIWAGPFPLPGGCERAVDVDDLGRIIGHNCRSESSSRLKSAVWLPPYTETITLTGLGDPSDAGRAWGISSRGSRIVGSASRVATLWEGVLTVP